MYIAVIMSNLRPIPTRNLSYFTSRISRFALRINYDTVTMKRGCLLSGQVNPPPLLLSMAFSVASNNEPSHSNNFSMCIVVCVLSIRFFSFHCGIRKNIDQWTMELVYNFFCYHLRSYLLPNESIWKEIRSDHESFTIPIVSNVIRWISF